MKSTAQRFGGPWTLLKTNIVASYLQFFVKALKNQAFQLVYIDAFAGSGAFEFIGGEDGQHSLFSSTEPASHAGSAQRALELIPPFDELIFIEKSSKNVKSLRKLIEASGHANASVRRGDANTELLSACDPKLWSNRRGVIFLDPFGMNVAWSTLETIRKSEALDLWLLYPLAGTVRNLPRRLDRLDPDKRAAVRRQFGNDNWLDLFYKAEPVKSRDLFDPSIAPKVLRTVSAQEVEDYFGDQLRSLFPYVSAPKRLTGRGNAALFSLFFAVSNPARGAIDLASRVAGHILAK